MSPTTILNEDKTITKTSYSCNQVHKTPSSIILVCQSIEENLEDYNDFCEYLAEENLAVYIHSYQNNINKDHNCPHKSYYQQNNQTILQDVMKLRTLISEKHGNTPVLLFGYSLGTIIALSTLINYPQKFSGIALWNLDLCFEKHSCMIMTTFLKMEKFFKGSDTPSRFMHHLTSNIWNRNSQNWKFFLKNSSITKNCKNNSLNFQHIPISVWIELMSMASSVNARGSFNPLSRFTPFLIIGGGNIYSSSEDPSQTYKLATRLQNEEFYDTYLMNLPAIQFNNQITSFPTQAIKKLRNWIVNSYLPKVTPRISQHKK
ncbi:serine aminopeptidase domain-containing protein [Candidatus Liberibacter brunswickensis]|uniref:serine aminopeptidase domain-containing protein n=1 Tax=Candidatus Liberibacter brunswickensis TaxID=1968796 RepID=UPI002FE22BE0